MSVESSPRNNQERFAVGETVYFVNLSTRSGVAEFFTEEEMKSISETGWLPAAFKLSITKGVVLRTYPTDEALPKKVCLQEFPILDEELSKIGTTLMMSTHRPEALLTVKDVLEAATENGIKVEEQSLDKLIKEKHTVMALILAERICQQQIEVG